MKKKFKILMIIVGISMTLVSIPTIMNHFNGNFGSLNERDKTILTEIETVFTSEKDKTMWENYSLSDKAIIVVNGRLGAAYMINPKEPINSIFAKEILMPEDYSIRVYRVAITAPQFFNFRGLIKFSTMNEKYTAFGNDVYFVQYPSQEDTNTQLGSSHFISFLYHEAFHYYMQNDWSFSGRFDTDQITTGDLALLEEQYEIFGEMQEEVRKQNPSQEVLTQYCKQYVDVIDRRIVANPDYVNAELLSETEEGTATYVEILATKAAGYPFDLMYVGISESKPQYLPFDVLIPAIKDGTMSKSAISTDIVYQSGALLCQVLETLDVENWQQQLNNQTQENPLTLYKIIKSYVSH